MAWEMADDDFTDAIADTEGESWSDIERTESAKLLRHASASRFPIVTIWEANRSSSQPSAICLWKAEPALVAKPCPRPKCVAFR